MSLNPSVGGSWNPNLAVGVPEIDRQHKELFATMDKLVVAMREGQGKDAVGPTLTFLDSYIRQHFKAEEQWMALTKYPDETRHRAEHVAFMKDFAALKDTFAKTGASPSLAIEVQRRTSGWLRDHIGKNDKALGAWLAARR